METAERDYSRRVQIAAGPTYRAQYTDCYPVLLKSMFIFPNDHLISNMKRYILPSTIYVTIYFD